MPLYEFHCKTCQQPFETIVSSHTAAKDVTCPRCGSREVEKTLSAPNLRMASGPPTPFPASSGCKPGSGFS